MPVVIGGDNLPSPVGIGLTYLPNIDTRIDTGQKLQQRLNTPPETMILNGSYSTSVARSPPFCHPQ